MSDKKTTTDHAFTIHWSRSYQGGRKYRRGPFTTNLVEEIEFLRKAVGVTEIKAAEPASPKPDPDNTGGDDSGVNSEEGDDDESNSGETHDDPSKEPDWKFRTKSEIKEWLDVVGVEYHSSANKTTLSELASGAWAEGRYPEGWGPEAEKAEELKKEAEKAEDLGSEEANPAEAELKADPEAEAKTEVDA